MKRALDALGPEPGDNEAVFLGEDGEASSPGVSLNVAQGKYPINVPYKNAMKPKRLGLNGIEPNRPGLYQRRIS